MGKIVFGYIMLDKLDKFIADNKCINMITNLNLLLERLYIEENNYLENFGFKTLDELYESQISLNSGVIKISSITNNYGTDGFLVIGHIKGTSKVVYTSLIANIKLSETIKTKNNSKINENGLLLCNLGIAYDYRGKGYCPKIINKVINKCKSIYGNGIIYSEILSSNIKSRKCHTLSGFTHNNLLTNSYGDDVFTFSF